MFIKEGVQRISGLCMSLICTRWRCIPLPEAGSSLIILTKLCSPAVLRSSHSPPSPPLHPLLCPILLTSPAFHFFFLIHSLPSSHALHPLYTFYRSYFLVFLLNHSLSYPSPFEWYRKKIHEDSLQCWRCIRSLLPKNFMHLSMHSRAAFQCNCLLVMCFYSYIFILII